MNKGMVVNIYEDPITENKLEGKAELMKYKLSKDFCNGYIYELWEVLFIDDGIDCEVYHERWIKARKDN